MGPVQKSQSTMSTRGVYCTLVNPDCEISKFSHEFFHVSIPYCYSYASERDVLHIRFNQHLYTPSINSLIDMHLSLISSSLTVF
jgi:hypothetical protein